MSARRHASAAGLAAIVAGVLTGCDDGGAGQRYRAERDFWQANRAAQRLEVNPDLVGENELLHAADRFLMVGAKYVGAVDAESVDEATNSAVAVARIGARAKLVAAQLFLRSGDAAMSRKVAEEVRTEMSWNPAAAMHAQVAIVDALRREGSAGDVVTEMWRLAEDYPAANDDGTEVHNAVFNAPMNLVRYVIQTDGDAEGAAARAIEYYEEVRDRWPETVTALLSDLHRSSLHDGLGDWQTAANILQSALDAYSSEVLEPEEASNVALTLGRLLMAEARDPERGIVALERATSIAPGTSPAWSATLALADHHASEGRFERAVELFRAVADGDPDTRDRAAFAKFSAAQALEASGRWEDARNEYDQLAVAYPHSPEAKRIPFVVSAHYRRTGESELANSILEKAEERFRREIRDERDSEETLDTYRYLFNVLAAREQWELAVSEMKVFTELFPGRPESALVLLQAAEIAKDQLHDPARAGELLRRVETNYPNSTFARRAAELRSRLTAD